MVKVRCPVCKGWGIVEAEFASGEAGNAVKSGCNKQCPACKGTGMQDVPDPTPYWYQPYPSQIPYRPNPWYPTTPWYDTTAGTITQQSNFTYTVQHGCGGGSCSCSKSE
jgi:hypothetical protein